MQSKQVTLKDKLDSLNQLKRHLENKLVTKISVINTLRNDHRLQLEQISVQQANRRREANAAVIQENSQLKITTKTLQTSLEIAARNNQSLANDRAELQTKTQLLSRPGSGRVVLFASAVDSIGGERYCRRLSSRRTDWNECS